MPFPNGAFMLKFIIDPGNRISNFNITLSNRLNGQMLFSFCYSYVVVLGVNVIIGKSLQIQTTKLTFEVKYKDIRL